MQQHQQLPLENIYNSIIKTCQQQQQQQLSQGECNHISKALNHYAKQLPPTTQKNAQVLFETTYTDFIKYQQRKRSTHGSNPVKKVMEDSPLTSSSMFQETGRRLDMLQDERRQIGNGPSASTAPLPPNFRIALDDDGSPSPAELFEKAKQAREREASRFAPQGSAPSSASSTPLLLGDNPPSTSVQQTTGGLAQASAGMNKIIMSDDAFRAGQNTYNAITQMMLQDRAQQQQHMSQSSAPKFQDRPLFVQPDGRDIIMANNPGIRNQGIADNNPTTTVPPFISPQKANLPQDYLIRQPDTLSYKEIENNLFIYSADRNWLQNVKENRYNFTVTFDPAANGPAYSTQLHVQEKFKNIVRIELVKAILPIEGTTVLIQRDVSGNTFTTATNDTAYQLNVLSYPFVTVNIPELENNSYGTDNFIDRAFGVIQYDQNWYSDPGTVPPQTDSRGYTALIPKFMKCQKVYAPTPLSTLTKLSINLLQPNGSSVSLTDDSFDISNVYAGNTSTIFSMSAYNTANADAQPQPYYFFINTNTYFSRFQIAVGDTIRVGGFGYQLPLTSQQQCAIDFVDWINRPQGHTVIGIGNITGGGAYADGPNAVGYANYIIIQSRFYPPETGSTALNPFGTKYGISVANNIVSVLQDATYVSALNATRRLINLNRQVQIVFRVITREMDGIAELRPDNNI